ncbi:TonB-dependent receptor [Aquimarina addita]|uniref:TonB-dependent receptor n=1 Tax=Aquimarina addita TaxID=870485 RepID=A0ABP7XB33_9FLAO
MSGSISDSLSQPIESVNVYLKQLPSNSIVAYTHTNALGKYHIKTDILGEATLSFSSLGYQTIDIPVIIKQGDQKLEDVILYDAPTQLDQVIIISELAITEKKDTIVFNASSFKQGEETVVQDLLRKLPGVDVLENGTIKVDGKEVEKVMVEGDDFFKKGYKLLTKNLDVNAINKVEVLRRYSNNKLLKGIEESQKVAINLKLDEDFKRDWFGNIASGYGFISENQYDVDLVLSNFGKKNIYFIISSLNNIGEDVTEDVKGLIYAQNDTDEPGSIGQNQTTTSFIDLPFSVPGLKKSRTNFNNAELASANSIFKISKKINLKILGLFNTDDASFFRNGTNTFTALSEDSFTNSESYELIKNTAVGYGSIELNYDISNAQSLLYEGKYNNSDFTTNTSLLFNDQQNNESLNDSNQLHDHMIKYSNRFRDAKVLILSSRFISEKRPEIYNNDQFLFEELFPNSGETTNIQQVNENKFDFFGLKSHVLDRKKNDDLLDISMGYTYRKDHLQSSLLLNQDQNFTNANDYTNEITYQVQDIYVTAGYRKKLRDIDLALNLEGHQLINELQEDTQLKKETPFLINTTVNFNWEINDNQKLFAFAEKKASNANLPDVYSNYALTGFRNFSRGTGTFNQWNSNKLFAGYNIGNYGSRFITNISISYVKDSDFLSENLQIEPNYTQSTKIKINNREFYRANVHIERYIKLIRNNFKLKTEYSVSEYKNIVNDSDLRIVEFEKYTIGFELRSGFKGIFNYHFGTTWDINKINTTASKNKATENTSFLDLSFYVDPRLTLEFQSERYYFSNLSNNDNSYYFMDMELRYKPKNTRMSFSLIGNNLFNTSRYGDYNITDTFISSTSYRLLPRYLLIKIGYKF